MRKVNYCHVENCTKPHVANGYCNTHYLRLKRHGTLEPTVIFRGGNRNHPYAYSYVNMTQRCNNPKATQYKDYGGRGITICDRWDSEGGFLRFLEDMGEKPDPSYTLDRKDTNGNYEPSNCKWSSRSEQQFNRRNSKKKQKKLERSGIIEPIINEGL